MISTKMVLNEFAKEADCEELIRVKEELVCEAVKDKVEAVPGVKELIGSLPGRLGLASTTSFVGVDAILKGVGLKDYFSVIHGGDSVKKGKPEPDIYLKTARLLHSKPEDCIVFEDSRSGVLAAKRAGMYVIGVLNGRNSMDDLQYADKVIEGFVNFDKSILKRGC